MHAMLAETSRNIVRASMGTPGAAARGSGGADAGPPGAASAEDAAAVREMGSPSLGDAMALAEARARASFEAQGAGALDDDADGFGLGEAARQAALLEEASRVVAHVVGVRGTRVEKQMEVVEAEVRAVSSDLEALQLAQRDSVRAGVAALDEAARALREDAAAARDGVRGATQHANAASAKHGEVDTELARLRRETAALLERSDAVNADLQGRCSRDQVKAIAREVALAFQMRTRPAMAALGDVGAADARDTDAADAADGGDGDGASRASATPPPPPPPQPTETRRACVSRSPPPFPRSRSRSPMPHAVERVAPSPFGIDRAASPEPLRTAAADDLIPAIPPSPGATPAFGGVGGDAVRTPQPKSVRPPQSTAVAASHVEASATGESDHPLVSGFDVAVAEAAEAAMQKVLAPIEDAWHTDLAELQHRIKERWAATNDGLGSSDAAWTARIAELSAATDHLRRALTHAAERERTSSLGADTSSAAQAAVDHLSRATAEATRSIEAETRRRTAASATVQETVAALNDLDDRLSEAEERRVTAAAQLNELLGSFAVDFAHSSARGPASPAPVRAHPPQDEPTGTAAFGVESSPPAGAAPPSPSPLSDVAETHATQRTPPPAEREGTADAVHPVVAGPDEAGSEDAAGGGRLQCHGTTKRGNRCRKVPVRGASYCHLHEDQARGAEGATGRMSGASSTSSSTTLTESPLSSSDGELDV